MERESYTDLFREPSPEDAREALRRRAAQARAHSFRVREAYRATLRECQARREGDREVELALAGAAHEGDAAAREALLQRFAPLVTTLARMNSGGSPARQAQLERAGFDGVATALDGWDPSAGGRFRDHAFERARCAIDSQPMDVRDDRV